MNILAIVGSLRAESYNHMLAEAAGEIIARNHPEATFHILDWGDVPLFNQDHEHPAPASVARVREEVEGADGLWIFSPEYNHYFPGTLKNLLDWLSRPVSEARGQVLRGKPVALAGTTPGMSGTSHAQDHLVTLLSFLQADIMNAPRLVIPHIGKQMENGKLILSDSAPYLEVQAGAFVRFIGLRQG